MVNWLEQLGYGQKVVGSYPGLILPGTEKPLSVNPAVKGYLFRIREI